ncbi:uncharacterized protein B0I36DRAFT_126522 [Microdochium trichocladiopsis]|uniref:Uncharacterized protein n=1 Tax=Microdochium trichocladiopsis TaxID=1682393 RepID=A0A9P9BP99_9PEZI|nr:uncharacterized protein B0I36DRAFT_126522 [Microdochium trichocladiopsis]KAH7028840.1 hypothetical protein B0I36DRAFT_126522 [Microdochium trichocladiopsis]
MSGFEVAGVVLGAFPLAIAAIDAYKRISLKVAAWRELRTIWLRCSEDLKNEQLAFKRHLKLLVLPLVVDPKSATELLNDPTGRRWSDADVADLLESKLGEAHDLYLSYVRRMHETLEELRNDMQIDSDLIQDKMTTQPAARSRVKLPMNKDEKRLQMFKMKFLQGESNRKRLLKQLRDCNEKLWKLLDSSEKDARLTTTMEAARVVAAADASLCKFWKTATAFFRALAAAYSCQCKRSHAARLLLQHRASCKTDAKFQMVFPLESTQETPDPWAACTTTIEETTNKPLVAESRVLVETRKVWQAGGNVQTLSALKASISKPHHHHHHHQHPRTTGATTMTTITTVHRSKVQFTPTISLTVPQDGLTAGRQGVRPITHLCESLASAAAADPDCREYLHHPEEDRRYCISSIARHTEMPHTITLGQVLSGDAGTPLPSRRETFAIAFVLASSLLQLQDSPWLAANGPRCFDKSSIVFAEDPAKPYRPLFDQPYIPRDFGPLPPSEAQSGGDSSTASAALARLGITLLELCFRSPLERQHDREILGPGANAQQRDALDFMAAAEWLKGVADEAGPEYAAVVKWCLLDNRIAPADRWREEMLRQVVRPLQRCLECFSAGGVTA